MKQFVRLCLVPLFAVLVLSPEVRALDPNKAITQYHQDVWTERDGLPQGSVLALAQTNDGYLWVGTRGGLARFDGVRFSVFRTENTPGLESDDIRAIHEDRSGVLWIGTFNGGVTRYVNGQFSRYSHRDGLPGNGVLDIHEDRQGNLWFATWDGLVRFRDGGFLSFSETNGLAGKSAFSLAEDLQGNIWIGSSTGLNCFTNGRLVSIPLPEGLRNETVRKVLIDRSGALWIGTIGAGMARYLDGKFTLKSRGDGLADPTIHDFFQDSDDNLWVATWNGLSRMGLGRIDNYREADGLPHSMVEVVLEDREANLWIGTRGGGLARLKEGKLSVITMKEGLPSNFAKCVLAARDGILWFGTDGGLSGLREGKAVHYRMEEGLPSNYVSALAEDAEGTIWAGTRQPAGIFRLKKDGTSETLTREQGLPIHQGVRVIFSDSRSNLWIGGHQGGLVNFRDGAFQVYNRAQGLPNSLIRMISEDRSGNLWVGSNDGLSRLSDGIFTTYTTRDGLPHNAVYAFYEDAEGTLWFGTQDGLARMKNGKFTAYTTREGLFQDHIFHVMEDHQKNLWMSGNRGIFSLSKSSIEAFDAGRLTSLPCFSYGVADGMHSSECQGGSQPAGARTADGRLWFPTVKGVAVLDPKNIRRNQQPPPVLIEEVFLDDRAVEVANSPRFDPGSGPLRFAYTALSLVAPEKVRFKYKLEGLDKKWIESEGRREAVYNKIPPGHYRFQVKASNNDGVWNESGATFAFSLAPYFYQTTWFYSICLVLAVAAAWSFHLHRMRQAKSQFSLILAERSRIAREIHDTLAQGFAGIGFQLEAVTAKLLEAPAQAQAHLVMALQMVRHSLAEAKRSVMNLRSTALENGHLGNALAETARQMMADKPVEVELKISGAVRPLATLIENNLLRIGQEAITNSLKYARAGRISIHVEYAPGEVRLSILDDGRGFNPEAAPADNSAHFGLLGMRERAKQMGARLEIRSRHGQGAEVIVEVAE